LTSKNLKQESDKESLIKHTDKMELNEKHLSLIYDTLPNVVLIETTILKDEQCNPYALVGIARGITGYKKIEKSLRIAHKNTRTILEKPPLGVVVISRDRNIKWANDSALKMAGVANADIMLGKNWGEYLCPAQQNECPILQ